MKTSSANTKTPSKTESVSKAETPSVSGSHDAYLEVLRVFPPRPIQNDADHQAAIAAIDGLLDRDGLSPDEEDHLEVLGLLVASYEDAIYERPDSTGLERLRDIIEDHQLTQATLARETGIPVQSLSDILTGKRGISAKVRQKLGARFGLPANFFA